MNGSALTDSEALFALAIMVVPWAVVACVAMLRGYSVKLWRNPRGRRDVVDDEDDDDTRETPGSDR